MQVGRSIYDQDIAKLGDRFREEIENVCGAKPQSCPWSAYRSDVVAEIQRMAACAEINPNEALNPLVPYLLYQGFLLYNNAVSKAKRHFNDKERKKREENRGN